MYIIAVINHACSKMHMVIDQDPYIDHEHLARVPIHDLSAMLPKRGISSCNVYAMGFNQTSKEDVALNDRLR